MVTPSACSAEHNPLQRLQLEQSSATESRTQRSCYPITSSSSSCPTSISNAASCFGLGRLSPAKLWLLAALLLLTVAASWPTGTSAAPRKARGAHLIWPHRHISTEAPAPAAPTPTPTAATVPRLHRRHNKARRFHHHVLREAVRKLALTEGVRNCQAMEVKPRDDTVLKEALQAAQNHKHAVICTTEDWLYNFYNNSNIVKTAENFHFHHLNLKHPLQDRVAMVNLTQEGTFEFEGPVGRLEEEMPKIIETLLVLEKLLKSVQYDKDHWNCTFQYILQAVQYNIARAMGMMKEQQCEVQQKLEYTENVLRLPFFVAMETIKVLTVVEYTYERLLNPV